MSSNIDNLINELFIFKENIERALKECKQENKLKLIETLYQCNYKLDYYETLTFFADCPFLYLDKIDRIFGLRDYDYLLNTIDGDNLNYLLNYIK